jgi:hypothetical protein
MVLGHWNQSDRTTTLKNTDHGPALTLKAKKGPALAINSTKRVKNLNADKLDGLSSQSFTNNRNSVYQWNVTSHAGGFSQPLPPLDPGSYLVTYSAQLTGAAGSEADPNVINCRVVQSGISGTIAFDKQIVGETTLTSVGTPPALSGSGPVVLVAGDSLRLACSMSRTAQQWSTTSLQPLTVNLLHTDGSYVYAAPLGQTAALKRTTN